MSRRKPKTKQPPKSVKQYRKEARELSKLVPALKKYRDAKELSPQQKGVITRYKNALKYTDHLIPLTKEQAKKLKDETYVPHSPDRVKRNKKTGEKEIIPGKPLRGVSALRLKGMSPNTKIKTVKGTDITIASNGRTWLFWKLDKLDRRWRKTLASAAETVFTSPESAWPIEKVAALAKVAFEEISQPKSIYLWTRHGPVGDAHRDLDEFMDWLSDTYVRAYKNTDDWMNGIAILVH